MPRVGHQVGPESIGHHDGIWIDLDRPVGEVVVAHPLHSLPNVHEKCRVGGRAVDADAHRRRVEVARPDRAQGPVAQLSLAVAGKDVVELAGKDADAAVGADLLPHDVGLVLGEPDDGEAVERGMAPGAGRTHAQLPAAPGRRVLVARAHARGAASQAGRPALVLLVTLHGLVTATHRLVAVGPFGRALRLHPGRDLHLRRGVGKARRAAAQRAAVPDAVLLVHEQGPGGAVGQAHGPALGLVVALHPRLRAALGLQAVLVWPRALLRDPSARLAPAAGGTGSAAPEGLALPRVVVLVHGVGAAGEALGLAGRPAGELREALHARLLAALRAAAVLARCRALPVHPHGCLGLVVGRGSGARRADPQGLAGPGVCVHVPGVSALDALCSASCPSVTLPKALHARRLAALGCAAIVTTLRACCRLGRCRQCCCGQCCCCCRG
mmetsp:Transcript_54422/g.168518  ORF Transcript_54422/g.168518 Transcript_54422/m.168518 type:complete len:440 (+) Transcript_54422:436-1755(+)